LGEFDLKGVNAPLRVYELQGVGSLRTRLEVSRSRGFSRFVGRQDETAALEAALGRAMGGSAQGVVGEPGVGKSRLCVEFLERCRARSLLTFASHFPRACAMRRVSAVCCRRPTLPSRIVQKWANRDCTLRPFFVTPK